MLFETISRELNRGLAESPRARALCAALRGQALRVEVTGTSWSCTLESSGEKLLLRAADGAAQATLSGSPLSLLALTAADQRAVIQRGDVRITGDAEVAQQFSELAQLLRPDLEHQLSRVFGRMPAHLLLRGARQLTGLGRKAADAGLRNTAEYLAHESRDLVPRGESEQFTREVEALRERLDRLDAQLALIERRRARLADSGAESRA